MNPDDDYFPKSARECVIVYKLLSELESYVEKKSQILLFGFIPIGRTLTKKDIRDWVTDQHILLSEVDK